MLTAATLQQIHEHGQHQSFQEAETDNPAKHDGQGQEIPLIKHQAERQRCRGRMFRPGDDHDKHRRRRRKGTKNDQGSAGNSSALYIK